MFHQYPVRFYSTKHRYIRIHEHVPTYVQHHHYNTHRLLLFYRFRLTIRKIPNDHRSPHHQYPDQADSTTHRCFDIREHVPSPPPPPSPLTAPTATILPESFIETALP